jgi:hypothetical protein
MRIRVHNTYNKKILIQNLLDNKELPIGKSRDNMRISNYNCMWEKNVRISFSVVLMPIRNRIRIFYFDADPDLDPDQERHQNDADPKGSYPKFYTCSKIRKNV